MELHRSHWPSYRRRRSVTFFPAFLRFFCFFVLLCWPREASQHPRGLPPPSSWPGDPRDAPWALTQRGWHGSASLTPSGTAAPRTSSKQNRSYPAPGAHLRHVDDSLPSPSRCCHGSELFALGSDAPDTPNPAPMDRFRALQPGGCACDSNVQPPLVVFFL